MKSEITMCPARRYNSWHPYEVYNDMNLYHFFREVLRQFSGLRSELHELTSRLALQENKMATVEETIKRNEAGQAEITKDLANVRRVVTVLQEQVNSLEAVVEELRGQSMTPEQQARLETTATKLEEANVILDQLAPDEVVPGEPVEPSPLPNPTDDTVTSRPRVRR